MAQRLVGLLMVAIVLHLASGNRLVDPEEGYNYIRQPQGSINSFWARLAHPVVDLVSNVRDFCTVNTLTDVGCCTGVYLEFLGFKNNVCGRLSVYPDKATLSRYMTHLTFYLDVYPLVDLFVSENEAPGVCVHAPILSFIRFCSQLSDIRKDVSTPTTAFCVHNSIFLTEGDDPFIGFDLCLHLGKPWSPEEQTTLPWGSLANVAHSVQALLSKWL